MMFGSNLKIFETFYQSASVRADSPTANINRELIPTSPPGGMDGWMMSDEETLFHWVSNQNG
jgi:hypothetical protein